MIEQKATVASRSGEQVWVEAERQSTCGQCQARRGCGTALFSKHVGTKFSRLAVKDGGGLRVSDSRSAANP